MNKQRGIIMSAPMALANLTKIKTETRRLTGLREINENLAHNWKIEKMDKGYLFSVPDLPFFHDAFVKCPYGNVGDILYQRENLYLGKDNAWYYKADDKPVLVEKCDETQMIAWAFHKEQDYCPSIHMPKFAARCLFEITECRIESLNDISLKGAKAEGIDIFLKDGIYMVPDMRIPWLYADKTDDPIRAYKSFVCHLNKQPYGYNPFVWVVKYKHIDKPKGGES